MQGMTLKDRQAVAGTVLWRLLRDEKKTRSGIRISKWREGIRICGFASWDVECPLADQAELSLEQYREFEGLKAVFGAIDRLIDLCDRCRPETPLFWKREKLEWDTIHRYYTYDNSTNTMTMLNLPDWNANTTTARTLTGFEALSAATT